MEYVLTTDALTKTYRHSRAVDGVSMHVARGEIYGFVGRNGAGKTTLMRIVCGLAGKSGGSYALFGKRDDSRGIDAARRRVGAIIETPSVFPEYTAEENLRVRITVDDTENLPYILERGLGIKEFKILSKTEADIYGEVAVGALALALHAGGSELLRVREKDEDLEGYFINLVGGR